MRSILIFCSILFCQLTLAHGYGFNFTMTDNEFVNSFNSISIENNLNDFEEGHEFAPLKSSIGITSPNSKTIWTIPDPAELEWNTMNISETKSIRFFLAKDDMVVQELGTFKNTGRASGIELANNIHSGDNYQVVGIELFPEDKFHIAKFATPYFSIRNKIAEARKAKAKQANNIIAPTKVVEKQKRMEFDGRNITYIKELSFKDEHLKVSIWDHGRQDGDIVSIYLNGYTIISKHLLTYAKKPIEITLDPSKKNDLFLYAHNLGEYAPNTVSIEISDGNTSENIVLNSDLKSCEAVMISVNK